MQTPNSYLDSPHQQRGVSLIEIMVTISLVVIFVLLTEAPARAFYNQQDISSTHHLLLSQLRRARSEARLLHQVVRLCQSNDFASCSNDRNWNKGWIIYVDLDNNIDRTSDEPIIEGHNALRDALSLRLIAGGRAKSLKIDPWGVIRSSGRFELCSKHMNKKVQTISFTRSGLLRPSVRRTRCVF